MNVVLPPVVSTLTRDPDAGRPVPLAHSNSCLWARTTAATHSHTDGSDPSPRPRGFRSFRVSAFPRFPQFPCIGTYVDSASSDVHVPKSVSGAANLRLAGVSSVTLSVATPAPVE